MNDEEYVSYIKSCSIEDLLDEVFKNPEYLTDSYYNTFGNAMYYRYLRLLDKGNPPPTTEYKRGHY